MPTTLALKNIPGEVYKRLRFSADAHRRSLNSEAIVWLGPLHSVELCQRSSSRPSQS